jgi:uncharacterized protein (TIGR04222 family)
MNTKHVELWGRLEHFQLDIAEAALPFSARLARENHWPADYAQRVIAEYKRFAFLAVTAGHPVSPSEDVDQAWHLHLTYSENYWKEFCPNILGKPLHHQPTRGGATERGKFEDWYARTLASYEQLFGQTPPQDIWPTPAARRGERHDFIRVDRERHWVICKPALRFNPKLAAGLGLGAVALLGNGAMLAQDANLFNWRGPEFLTFYFFLFAGCFGVALALRRQLRVPAAEHPVNAADLDGYATAFLNGGRVLAVNTAITTLANQRAVNVPARAGRVISVAPAPAFAHPLEQSVYDAANANAGITISSLRQAMRPAVTRIAAELQSRGLIVNDANARRAIAIPLLIAFAAVAVGVIKLGIGVTRGKPVGYLIALCIISVIISLIAFARRPLRTRKGDAVLARLRESHVGPKQLGRNVSAIPAAEIAAVVGLFGMTALAGTDLGGLRKALQPPANAGSTGCGTGCGSSCGGSCGRGGGGGGCGGGGCGGGCGGCGG